MVDIQPDRVLGGPVLDLGQLLHHSLGERASDVHIKVGARPHLRVDGELVEAPFEVVEPDDAERLAASLLPQARAERFQRTGDADFVHAVAGIGRFRVSVFRQRGRVGMVLRRVLPGIPGFEGLGLPPVVGALMEHQAGLVVVSGLAGSGRTSTLAAMVDHVNEHEARHVVTIEDPIEVLHHDKRSIVDQREVGTDTVGVREALLASLRQDPDVIVVGEVDDESTVRSAIEAADAGHLVVVGMTVVTASRAVVRLLELFPDTDRRAVGRLLGRTLRGVTCQRLLPRSGGRGRVPVVEVLVGNGAVKKLLAAGEVDSDALTRVIEEGEFYGMRTFDDGIVELYARGLLEADVAVANATQPATVRTRMEQADSARLAASAAPVAPPRAPGSMPPPPPGRVPAPPAPPRVPAERV